MVRVGKIFSPEFKDVVSIVVDHVWWLWLMGLLGNDVQKLAHCYELFLNQAAPFADLCLFRSQLLKSLAKDYQSLYLKLILVYQFLLVLGVLFPEWEIGLAQFLVAQFHCHEPHLTRFQCLVFFLLGCELILQLKIIGLKSASQPFERCVARFLCSQRLSVTLEVANRSTGLELFLQSGDFRILLRIPARFVSFIMMRIVDSD